MKAARGIAPDDPAGPDHDVHTGFEPPLLDEPEISADSEVQGFGEQPASLQGQGQPIEGGRRPGSGGARLLSDKVRFSRQDGHEAENRSVQTGLEPGAEEGQQFMPQPVALEMELVVAGVFAESDVSFMGKTLQAVPGQAEQRTDQLHFRISRRRADPFHSRQALRTGPAQQSEEEQFDLVVRMVRQSNLPDVQAGGRSRQEPVAEVAGSHLKGKTVTRRPGSHVGSPDFEGQTQTLGSRAHELLIGIAGMAAELVVEMGKDQPPPVLWPDFIQKLQQDHRIESAGHRYQNGLAGGEQPLFHDAGLGLSEGLVRAHPFGKATVHPLCRRVYFPKAFCRALVFRAAGSVRMVFSRALKSRKSACITPLVMCAFMSTDGVLPSTAPSNPPPRSMTAL